jgi:hypothetical protein
VGIFLTPDLDRIEMRSDSRATDWKAVKTVDAPNVYQCALYLSSNSWSQQVPYLTDAGGTQALAYQNGESAFPSAAKAPYVRVLAGRITN